MHSILYLDLHLNLNIIQSFQVKLVRLLSRKFTISKAHKIRKTPYVKHINKYTLNKLMKYLHKFLKAMICFYNKARSQLRLIFLFYEVEQHLRKNIKNGCKPISLRNSLEKNSKCLVYYSVLI